MTYTMFFRSMPDLGGLEELYRKSGGLADQRISFRSLEEETAEDAQLEEGSETQRGRTYTTPARIAIRTGTPTPTLTPIIILLLTPPVLPLMTGFDGPAV